MPSSIDGLTDLLCTDVLGGQEILVNIADGLDDGSIDPARLQLFARACLARLDQIDRADELFETLARNAIMSVVFTPPVDEAGQSVSLQYAAMIEASDDHVTTFMTLAKLRSLVPEPSRLAAALKEEMRGELWSGSDPRFINDEMGRAIADIVNEEGTESHLHLSKIAQNAVPYPIWITRSTTSKAILDKTEPQDRATRMRDWLGLGYLDVGSPLFGFQSDRSLPSLRPARLGRPTVWDGIDHRWFKHRRSPHSGDRWGRTMDFEAAVACRADCDGGPEAVMPGPAFDEGFTCFYVGTVRTVPMPPTPHVLAALMASNPPRQIARLKQRVVDALADRP